MKLQEDLLIAQAMSALENRLRKPGRMLKEPDEVKKLLALQLAEKQHEEFIVIFLTHRHNIIEIECVSTGSLSEARVHAREIVKRALFHNAAAVILGHNHPSGVPEPSQSDERITQQLKEALGLIDVRVLDHIIIGGMKAVSFVQRGLL